MIQSHRASTPLTTHDSTLPETHPPSHTHSLTLCLHSPPHHNSRRLLHSCTTLRPPSIFSSSLYHSHSATTRPQPQQPCLQDTETPQQLNASTARQPQQHHRSPATAAQPFVGHINTTLRRPQRRP
ncbi:hypothetical protein ACFE04_000776 [Oxalis oulophora]